MDASQQADQILAAMDHAQRLAWVNAVLHQDERISEAILNSSRGQGVDPHETTGRADLVELVVVRAFEPRIDPESGAVIPGPTAHMTDMVSPVDQVVIPSTGWCFNHSVFEALLAADLEDFEFEMVPVKTLWVPAGAILVQFSLCHGCAERLEAQYGTLDWRPIGHGAV